MNVPSLSVCMGCKTHMLPKSQALAFNSEVFNEDEQKPVAPSEKKPELGFKNKKSNSAFQTLKGPWS